MNIILIFYTVIFFDGHKIDTMIIAFFPADSGLSLLVQLLPPVKLPRERLFN